MISYQPLINLIEERGLTLKDLETAGGFSSATLAKLKKGESITTETIDRLCLLLKVPVEMVFEIVGYDDSESNLPYRAKKRLKMNILKEIRTSRKMTQIELAELLNVHQPSISLWEKDSSKIPDEILEKVKEALNVSDDELQEE